MSEAGPQAWGARPTRLEARLLRPSRRAVGLTFAVLAIVMFGVDLLLPLGVAAGVPYALLVLAGLWWEGPRATILAAAAASGLTLVGALLSPPGETPFLLAWTNRSITVLVTWALAFVLIRQKETKRLLRAEQRGARDLLELVEVVIVHLDSTGVVRRVNRRACEVLGRSPSEVVGHSWFEFVPDGDEPGTRDVLRELVSGAGGEHHENPIVTATGERRILVWHNAVLRDEDGRVDGVLASGMDVTERRAAEAEFRRREALAQVGQMAAVVAHEVRNPLAGIAGALQIIGGRLPAGSPDREITDEILGRIGSLNELVGELLLYTRPREPKMEPLELGELLHNVTAMVERDPQFEGVRFEQFGHDVRVQGDAEQLRILFSNLLLNAAQAMEGHGSVRIHARNEGPSWRVTVSDTGPGIPEDRRARVFEPFFTTRSRGTGLGLAIAQQVVRGHRGAIAIDCPEEGGTTVTVTLPRA